MTLVTRTACPLCDEARAVLARLGVGFEELDVDTAPGLPPQRRREWSEMVPVVLVDGRVHGYWTVEPDRLRQALGG